VCVTPSLETHLSPLSSLRISRVIDDASLGKVCQHKRCTHRICRRQRTLSQMPERELGTAVAMEACFQQRDGEQSLLSIEELFLAVMLRY
jgi:hypothetical protein